MPHIAPTKTLKNKSKTKLKLNSKLLFKIENNKKEKIVYKNATITPFISPFLPLFLRQTKTPTKILMVFIIWFIILMPKSDKSKNLKVKANNKIPAKEKQIANNTPFDTWKNVFFSLKTELSNSYLQNKKLHTYLYEV